MKCKRLWLIATTLSVASVASAQYSIPPTNLTGVNTIYTETSPSLSADGLTLYFGSDRPDGQGNLDLWQATRPDLSSSFGEVNNLAMLNGSSHDTHPWISGDGLSLVFASSRTGGQGDYDLWMASRANALEAFSVPVNLGTTINTSYRDSRPCLSFDGLDLYFTSNRPGGEGNTDLWVSSRSTPQAPFGPAVNLGPSVNTPYREGGAGISSDGMTLFFNVDRPDGFGSEDLYVATRSSLEAPFEETINLGNVINSTGRDNAPTTSSDGTLLVFMSDRPGGAGGSDLWMTTIPEPATLSLLALGGVAMLRRRKQR